MMMALSIKNLVLFRLYGVFSSVVHYSNAVLESVYDSFLFDAFQLFFM